MLILCNESAGRMDAIRDASMHLARALECEGVSARVIQRADGRRLNAWPGTLEAADLVLLQYSPFSYGRWGFAPWLVAVLWRLRRRRPRPVVGLVVHEPYVPMRGWRWTLMGLWQRAQLVALRATSDMVLTSIEAWAKSLRRLPPARPTMHLPVGSNLPDRRSQRDVARALLGVGDDTLLVATLSTGHPSHDLSLVEGALRALAASGRSISLLALGAGSQLPPGIPVEIPVMRPGEMPAEDLAAYLAAADLFLAPFVDGVSSRRTSAMAALQHGLAVVATDGVLTDSLFHEAGDGIRLVPVDRPERFVAEVLRLAGQPAERAAMGNAGRRLYETTFDWQAAARRLLLACAGQS